MTPGPWRIVPDATHKGNLRIAGRAFDAIAKVYAEEPRTGDAKATANAKAIAAVPDMVAALKEACDLLAERTFGSHARSPGHNARLVLEDALKKAGQL